jgi:hypothetical protein
MESSHAGQTLRVGGNPLGASKHQNAQPLSFSLKGEMSSLVRSTSAGVAKTQESYLQQSLLSPSVSPSTDDSHSNVGNERVVFRAQFRSCEPMSSSEMFNVLKIKRGTLNVLRDDSSVDTSKVSFSPLRDGRLSIDTTCCIIAGYLREVPYLEQFQTNKPRGVCYLEASQECSEAELLEEVQQANANIGITKLDKMKGNHVIITFSSSLPPAIFYF